MNMHFKRFRRMPMLALTLTLFICLFTMESYADSLKVSEIVSPQYDQAMRFTEGLLAVKKGGKWGYIDKSGNVMIDFNYHIAYPFSEGKALVALEGIKEIRWSETKAEKFEGAYWGIIDKRGNFTKLRRSDGEPIFIFLEEIYGNNNYTSYHNGVLVTDVLDSPVNFAFDNKGMEIQNGYGAYPLNEGILAVNFGIANFIDFNTGEILFKDRNFYDIRPFNQGLAPVALDEESSDIVWRFMNANGQIMKDITFVDFQVKNMSGEYKIFNDNSLASIENSQGKWGAIDKTGATIIPFKYDSLKIFSEGLAGFKSNGKYGFIDTNGNLVIEAIYDNVSSFNDGLAAVCMGDKAYLIDKEGRKILGSDAISKSTYFEKAYYGSDSDYYTYAPSEYVIIEKNAKYGLAKVDLVNAEEETVEKEPAVEDTIAKELVVSSLVEQMQLELKADFANKASPAPGIKILVNSKEKSLSDPIIIENSRVFLPVRALGDLLDISVDYIESNKVAIAENAKAKLELPLGYNQAVKDMSLVLPIDEANKSTRILSYNSRTYLPVRFISENLGFNIDYADKTISITETD